MSARDFSVRSQLAAYESHRAYFEAYNVNKGKSTGCTSFPFRFGFRSAVVEKFDSLCVADVQWMLQPGRPQNEVRAVCRFRHMHCLPVYCCCVCVCVVARD